MNTIAPVVVYDACLLYPALLRDFLMRLAVAGCMRAHWSRKIQDEWKFNLLRNRPGLSPSQIDETIYSMEAAIPDALVESDAGLISSFQLPDPNDCHVLATAIQCRASVIMTFNLRDFPREVLRPFGVEAQHPDDVVARLSLLNRRTVIEVVRKHRAKLIKPRLDADAYLNALRKQGLVQTSKILASYRGEI